MSGQGIGFSHAHVVVHYEHNEKMSEFNAQTASLLAIKAHEAASYLPDMTMEELKIEVYKGSPTIEDFGIANRGSIESNLVTSHNALRIVSNVFPELEVMVCVRQESVSLPGRSHTVSAMQYDPRFDCAVNLSNYTGGHVFTSASFVKALTRAVVEQLRILGFIKFTDEE